MLYLDHNPKLGAVATVSLLRLNMQLWTSLLQKRGTPCLSSTATTVSVARPPCWIELCWAFRCHTEQLSTLPRSRPLNPDRWGFHHTQAAKIVSRDECQTWMPLLDSSDSCRLEPAVSLRRLCSASSRIMSTGRSWQVA